MNTENNKIQVNVAVDFEIGRGFGPVGVGLSSSFLTGESRHVAATIAMLYANPNKEHTNKYSQALSVLALYAGGAQVSLTKAQFRQLERRLENYCSIASDFHLAGTRNWDCANYVLRRAIARAKRDGVIGKREAATQALARVDFEGGRGFGDTAAGLPDSFLAGDRLSVATTIAMLYAHPAIEHATQESQAISVLALYAGGVAVTLTTKQYRWLERQVRRYASYMRAEQFEHTRNQRLAHWVLRHAAKRAKSEKVI